MDKTWSSINNYFNKRAERDETYFFTFGWFLVITYPSFYFYNLFYAIPQSAESIKLRVIIACLGIILLTHKFDLRMWKNFKGLIWLSILTISLPFFFLFMLLQNPYSNIWQINCLFGLSLLTLFVNFHEFVILTILGFSTAYILSIFRNPFFTFPIHLIPILQTYCFLIVYFLIYSRKKKIFETQQIQNLKFQSGTIAHEMRTPLGNMTMIAHALETKISSFEHNHNLTSDNSYLNKTDLIMFKTLTGNLKDTAKNAQNIIDLMLFNLKQDVEQFPLSNLSMKNVTQKALDDYPFNEVQQSLIELKIEHDFIFLGNQDLMKHIYYNLFKNSLYYIHAANKGTIEITITVKSGRNKVIFKDTACGIPPKILPNLFKPFISTRLHGTGIGLAFCKRVMDYFNGKINVISVLNEHTTFILHFK